MDFRHTVMLTKNAPVSGHTARRTYLGVSSLCNFKINLDAGETNALILHSIFIDLDILFLNLRFIYY